jgi:glutamate-1-semialdehyde 2,1-aminomutase
MLRADLLQGWAGEWLGLIAGRNWRFEEGWGWTALGVMLGGLILTYAVRRLVRLGFTLRAAAVTPMSARLLSKVVKRLDYDDEEFLRADGAPERWAEIRRLALVRLAEFLRERSPKSIAWGNEIRESFSDLRFTDANRVPFPFMRAVRERFNLCAVVTESKGPKLRDLDGNWSIDVSGSYGLNVAGFDQYKEWIEKGWERVKELGPVLGPLHPLVADNIARLKEISKLDEVSFHMSGTEAVMAAVRLARFNTRKQLIVCFAGAYHGWWDGVQPGLGSERQISDCLTLKDMNPASIDLIRRRAKEIAGVLVNPVQSFHPNMPPPSDSILITSGMRKTQDSTSSYAQWLRQLRDVCTECGIPLIFDEVFSGFRLAPGGAQEYFSVHADIVVYGKTVAGGMPIGLVCGRKDLMRRFDPDYPMRIAYVIGTFSAHPLVMGAMNEFLRWLAKPATAKLYEEAQARCDRWVLSTNARLASLALPLRIMNLATVWTVLFKEAGRYNWLLQYYLRAESLTLSWVGTGRCMSSLDFSDEDYAELQAKIIEGGQKMKSDGWWLDAVQQPAREKTMRRNLMLEMARSILQVPRPIKDFYTEIMERKGDDHVASHSNLTNQLLHLLSSSTFIVCYVLFFFDFTLAVTMGTAALLLRQFGHAILEPPCHDKEKTLLGYNTRNKSMILFGYVLIPIMYLIGAGSMNLETIRMMLPSFARTWFALTMLVVGGRVVYLAFKHNFRSALIWFVKLITDPITDIIAYYSSVPKVLEAAHIRKSDSLAG